MTQRIFDTDNEEDMKLLWSILPDDVTKIKRINNISFVEFSDDVEHTSLIKINWHDKTEITRPVDYEKMIGCVGWIGDDASTNRIGVLAKYHKNDEYSFETIDGAEYRYFRPAKKSELKFWGD